MSESPDDMKRTIRGRLSSYEEQPDTGLWQQIEQRTDVSLGDRLGQYEEIPDAAVWTAVEKQMSTRSPWKKVVQTAFLMLILSSLMTTSGIEWTLPVAKEQPTAPQHLANEIVPTDQAVVTHPANEDKTINTHDVAPRVVIAREKVEVNERSLLPAEREPRQREYTSSLQFPVVNPHMDGTLWVPRESKPANTVKKFERPARERRTVGAYALVMPTLGYQEVTPRTDDNVLIAGIDKLSAFSPRRLGIRAEAGLQIPLTEKWELNTGALLYVRSQTIGYRYYTPDQVLVTPMGNNTFEVRPEEQHGTFEYTVRNIGLFAGVNYQFKAQKYTQRLGAGLELHKGLSGQGRLSGDNLYLFGHLYYRLEMPLSKRFSLLVQPTLNYSLRLNERLTAPFYVKPYGLGLHAGVAFKF